MSGFRDHFLDKYFAYRRKYVDYVAVEAPRRTQMAVLSEVARLAFMSFGAVLCALIFAPLVYAAYDRHGYVAVPIFAALSAMSLYFGVLSVRGLSRAWADPRRRIAPSERERPR